MNRPTLALVSLAFPAVVGGVYFSAAGRVDLPAAWAVLVALGVFGIAVAACADKGLIAERTSPKGQNRDKVGQRMSTALLFVHWLVAGLDVGRFGWSPIPPSLRTTGACCYLAALALLFWAMRANSFYSSVVRVQGDRGQTAVAAGPYRIVRHPGYTGTILGGLAGAFAFGSWAGMAPMLMLGVLFVRRTRLEDHMLRAELPGYADYAARVRYRLLPGVY